MKARLISSLSIVALLSVAACASEVDTKTAGDPNEELGTVSEALTGYALSQSNATIVYKALRNRGNAIPNTTACAPLRADVQTVLNNSDKLSWMDLPNQVVDGLTCAYHQGYTYACGGDRVEKVEKAMEALVGVDADACFRSYNGDTHIKDFLKRDKFIPPSEIYPCHRFFWGAAVIPGN